jgi:hypothetical protein
MNYTKATNKQLDAIFTHDNDCPNELLLGLVEEMMRRRLFDGMIVHVVQGLMRSYNKEEVIQLCHVRIYQMVKNFKQGNLPFKRMTFLCIERTIKNLITHMNTQKYKLNEFALQNEIPVIKDMSNVEKTVIQKIVLEEQLNKLTAKERYIIDKFLKGYSIRYQAKHFFHKDPKAVEYHFKKALKKMDITDYKIGPRAGLKGA